MYDPVAVRSLERVADLNGNRDRALERHRARQRLTVDVLHHQIRGRTFRADVMQRADVRMIECRDRPSLAIEPATKRRIAGEEFGKDLDSNRAIETRVARSVDL